MAKSPRERLIDTINHRDPGKVVVDLGSTGVSGISIIAMEKLRRGLGLAEHTLTMDEPLQLLGMVEDDLLKAVGGCVVGVNTGHTIFGYKNRDWKHWTMPNGMDVLVSEEFRTTVDEKGNTYTYANGDMRYPPSGRMPRDGHFFDNITRSDTTADDDGLNAREDYKDDFSLLTDDTLRDIEERVRNLYDNTDYGIMYNAALCGIGDFALVPGPHVPQPKGIRDLEEFMMAHYLAPDYIHELFEMQLEYAIKNAELLYQAVGDRIQTIYVSGTDFGLQRGPYMAPDAFREFYKPIFTRINGWIHEHTHWKTFFHSCGSVVCFIPDFIECGVDILNPVQVSAEGMDPATLKAKWGDRLVFWGGGINPQTTLPFGTPEECYDETKKNLGIFAPGGGYVFNTVHNILGHTPMENMVAMYRAVSDYNKENGFSD